MNTQKPIMAAALVALGIVAASTYSNAATNNTEKCSGVVKAGMNDCAANGHACAGMAKTNSAKGEWITVAKGTCAKLTGGVVIR
ncbi:DUF2282 domain-containing protein [Thiolinea disciformis]|uniref:BufA1 family periplasmic bufferin-type metallophore n=1 Tax=Thiolinea disciformis TaxID=125614 RepID=UPI000370458A|nr:DUF2282 domain-containing protein [Thiolinea disciformis]